jgi:hypothetical protein
LPLIVGLHEHNISNDLDIAWAEDPASVGWYFHQDGCNPVWLRPDVE